MKTYTFTKVFTSGSLEGLCYAGTIKFESWDRACAWYDAVNDKWAKGESNFYLEDLDEEEEC